MRPLPKPSAGRRRERVSRSLRSLVPHASRYSKNRAVPSGGGCGGAGAQNPVKVKFRSMHDEDLIFCCELSSICIKGDFLFCFFLSSYICGEGILFSECVLAFGFQAKPKISSKGCVKGANSWITGAAGATDCHDVWSPVIHQFAGFAQPPLPEPEWRRHCSRRCSPGC